MMDVGNVNDRWIWRGVKPNDTTTQPAPLNSTQAPTSLLTSTTHLDLNPKWSNTQTNDHITSQETEITIPWLWDYDTLASLFNFPEATTKVDQLEPHTSEGEFSRWSWRANQTLVTSKDTNSNLGITATNFKSSLNYSSFHSVLTQTPYSIDNYGNHSHLYSSQDMSAIQNDDLLYYILLYVVISILVLLLFVSIAANSLILVTILCRNYLRKTFFLHISLAASDLMASVFTVPIFILCILQPDGLPLEACTLVTAAVILTMHVSAGSIASLCAVRWWQFVNFSEIQTREKLAIPFVILTLWISGFGITTGFVFQDTNKMDITCTLDYITTIFRNTLSFTSVSISASLFVTVLVNYLTVKRIKKKSIYSHRCKGSKSSSYTQVNHKTRENFNSYVNTPEEFNISSGSLNCNSSQSFHKNVPIQKVVTNETARNKGLEHGSLNNSTQERQTPTKMSAIREKLGSDQTELLSCGKRTSGLQKEIYLPSDLSLDKVLVTATTLSDSQDKNDLDQKENALKRPKNVIQELKCCESDVESEHLYEVIEPLDVQEQIPQNSKSNYSVKLPTAAISLPNAVEKVYNTNPMIKRHQTTIINVASAAPDNHVVNALAWTKNGSNFLPCQTVENMKILYKTTFNTTEQPMNYKEITNQDPLPILKNPLFTNTGVEKATTDNISTSVSSKNMWGSAVDPFQESPTRKMFYPLMEIEDSLCARYMADLSAHSSQHSTPHHKLGRKQCTERINALVTARTNSGLAAAIDSDFEESPNFVALTPKAGQNCHYQSSPYPKLGCKDNPELGMHPVCQKCIQISCHLIAIFAVPYLPLLALQIALSVVMNHSVLFLIMIYQVLLLALHPTFYLLQSPILKNAVRKMAQTSRFSTSLNTAHHQRTSSLIPQHHVHSIQLRSSSHPQSPKRPAHLSNRKVRPWSHPV